jgi:hypothetical protein
MTPRSTVAVPAVEFLWQVVRRRQNAFVVTLKAGPGGWGVDGVTYGTVVWVSVMGESHFTVAAQTDCRCREESLAVRLVTFKAAYFVHFNVLGVRKRNLS